MGESCTCPHTAAAAGNRTQKLGERGRQGEGSPLRSLDTSCACLCSRLLWELPHLEIPKSRTWRRHGRAQHPKRTRYPPQERKYRANPGYGAQAGCPVRLYLGVHVPFSPAVPGMYLQYTSVDGLAGLLVDGKGRSWIVTRMDSLLRALLTAHSHSRSGRSSEGRFLRSHHRGAKEREQRPAGRKGKHLGEKGHG